MDKSSLGDRMKAYERHNSKRKFMHRLPIVVRLDGRKFSNFTKGFKRPYDVSFRDAMTSTTIALVKETNSVVGYTQSDEISLIIDENYFDGRIDKITSILASTATATFLYEAMQRWPDKIKKLSESNRLPTFDCRAFNVPDKMEAVNAIVWREQDATKNSITMAAQCYFSHKELMGKSGKEKQEMLFSKHGINFNDYPAFFKRGTYVKKVLVEKLVTDELLSKISDEIVREGMRIQGTYRRHEIKIPKYPPLTRVANKVEMIYNNEKSIMLGD